MTRLWTTERGRCGDWGAGLGGLGMEPGVELAVKLGEIEAVYLLVQWGLLAV